MAVQQVQLTNPSGSTVGLTGLILSVFVTGNPGAITSVALLKNGAPVTTLTISGGTASFTFSDSVTASSSVTYTVEANFGYAAGGTYQFSITGATGSANGQAVQFNGLPVAGATVTVIQPTFTSTPSANEKPVIYPNPVTGPGPVQLHISLVKNSDVKVEIYTLAFRKVNTLDFDNVLPGQNVSIPLTDKSGMSLANGLYYFVVEAAGKKWIVKVLVIR